MIPHPTFPFKLSSFNRFTFISGYRKATMFVLPMRAAFIFALLGACLADVEKDGDVLIFTEANFDDEIKKHDIILIEFYAPWCGHCKALKPEYEKAATILSNDDTPVPLAKVDCDAEKTLCQKYDVSGYPTLKIFRDGQFSKAFEGPRQSDGIVKHMRGQAGPSSTELKTEKDAEKMLLKDEFLVMGCFAKDSKIKETFMKIASAEREDYRFCHTSEKSLLEKYKCKDNILVFQPKKLHSKFEKPIMEHNGAVDTDEIKKFLKFSVLGLCSIRETSNAEKYEKPLVVVYYDVDHEKNPKGTNYYRNRVMKVAQDYKDKMNFAVSSNKSFSHELEQFGLSGKDKVVVACHGKKGEKFPMSTDFSVENLKKFVDDILAGKIEAYLKSEPVPEANDAPVKIAVAKNFDELVNDETKDVLIEFYAPWCGHCKSLAPKYDELAEKLKNEPGIRIVKMDATANDVPPPFDVRGFPTLFWVPRNGKDKPVSYDGGREVKDFIQYISEKAADELVGYTRAGKKKKEPKKEEL